MEHKVVITNNESTVNTLLNEGWLVVSVTSQIVSAGNHAERGLFCFVLCRTI